MRLTPWEEERLLLFGAAELARRHRAAGIALNAPEAVALICDAMLEAARAGGSYADVEAAGLAAVSPDEVLPGVRELVEVVSLEMLLEDGTRLITLVDPLGRGAPADPLGPGAIAPAPGAVEEGVDDGRDGRDGRGRRERRERRELTVRSTSRRAIRVTSHFPFDRVNPRLVFDREAARGFRLDIEAGSSERWAPGEERTVRLVRFGGDDGDTGAEGNGTAR
ncbi:MAG TPA: urease subunit gamma [Candidatus Binatia bacterium]|nr:urease subunit gamma [Candidatus Binatia bacterium]